MKDWLEIAKWNETTAYECIWLKHEFWGKIQMKMKVFGRILKTRYKMMRKKLAYEERNEALFGLYRKK